MVELVKSGDKCIGPTIDSAGAVGTKVEEIDPANLRPGTFGIDLRESVSGDQGARVVMIAEFREPHQRFEFRLASPDCLYHQSGRSGLYGSRIRSVGKNLKTG